MAHVERFAYADARQAIEHGLRRIGRSREDFQDLEFSGCEIDAIGKGATSVDRYAQVVLLLSQSTSSVGYMAVTDG